MIYYIFIFFTELIKAYSSNVERFMLPNLMQINSNKELISLTLGSAHEKFDVGTIGLNLLSSGFLLPSAVYSDLRKH